MRLFQSADKAHITGDNLFDLAVVGESRYQDNLERICGPRSVEGEDRIVTATLVLDDGNRHDKQAVRVEIDGLTVGYLDRASARAYRQALKKAGRPGVTATCRANIRGGWDRGGGQRGHYGVWLDVPVVDRRQSRRARWPVVVGGLAGAGVLGCCACGLVGSLFS